MSFTITKGQGATEYLVLLAVVLIVAMVAIALLGFFPGMSYDAKKSEADSYWQSARPFQIKQHAQPAGGALTLVVSNVNSDQLKLTNVSVSGGGASAVNSTPGGAGALYLSGGQTANVLVFGVASACNASGNVYEYSINVTYDGTGDNPITGQKQYGAKTIIGKCA